MTKTNISMNNQTILITGCAGFIGANLATYLLDKCQNSTIIGVDNLNNYYDKELKEYRLELIKNKERVSLSKYLFIKLDISDKEGIQNLFEEYHPSIIINLAAQAGVRYSIKNPDAYISSNILGFYNILECCRHSYDGGQPGVKHLVYASSSSVYGGNTKVPFSEDDLVDHPVSLYAATKKSNELLAHSYSKLYNIPCTGLRFFTVYGPAGRPDMAYFSFTEKLRTCQKINIFNNGNCKRDFTYINDIVEGVMRVVQGAPNRFTGSDNLPVPPYAIYNIGNSNPENLMDFVHILSEELKKTKILPDKFNIEDYIELVPMQPGDVPVTYADTSNLEHDYGFKPTTDLRTGLREFAEWYKKYYNI
ncbi:NAD-dependent epimerase/dehydratase family protein [bacterium D16-54]|nr:NAD-dependent epimerase/dehydratase family protein [bacterium D16-54]RKJ13424.1 NAD-dependent epimerase/dehydratase family protein [bacterium D16-56]